MRRFGEEGPRLLSAALLVLALAATVLAAALLAGEVLATGAKAVPAPAAGVTSVSQMSAADRLKQTLTAAGWVEIGQVRQRGPNFTVEASTLSGVRARMVISGATGQIIGIRMLDGVQGLGHREAAQR